MGEHTGDRTRADTERRLAHFYAAKHRIIPAHFWKKALTYGKKTLTYEKKSLTYEKKALTYEKKALTYENIRVQYINHAALDGDIRTESSGEEAHDTKTHIYPAAQLSFGNTRRRQRVAQRAPCGKNSKCDLSAGFSAGIFTRNHLTISASVRGEGEKGVCLSYARVRASVCDK